MTGTTIRGETAPVELSISYDADTGGYTVAVGGARQTFTQDNVLEQDDYDIRYFKATASGNQYLTLVKSPYSGNSSPEYVGMGFWQRNSVDGSNQDVEYAAFTYGLPTGAAMVPRSGQAAYAIDLFGLVTMPGEEPLSFQGPGQLNVDFAQGIFATHTYVTERGLVTDYGVVGGGIELLAGGSLSASDGSFSGSATYGSSYGTTSGTIAGQFYGPAGEEVGATFQSAGLDGLTAVGSFFGVQDPGMTPVNQSLTNMTHEEYFYAKGIGGHGGSFNWLNSETFVYGPPSSDMAGGRYTIDDKVASTDPNFSTYVKSYNNVYGRQDVVLRIYKVGPANSEIALTYSNFGHWEGTRDGSTSDYFFHYGFQTFRNGTAARSGTARYRGVIHGIGVNADASRKYDIAGNSRFDIDFLNQQFAGSLAVTGKEQTSSAFVDFGSYDVDGVTHPISSYLVGDIFRSSTNLGSFQGYFYGPDAQEMAGVFHINTQAGTGDMLGVGIQGVTVTVRD